MKILITGGQGFIARNLCEHLAPRHSVTIGGRAELDLMDSDRVAACLQAGRFDAVIHSATYDAAPKHSRKDPAKVLESNLRMFFNLARCHGSFGRMLYFGSGAEFSREFWVPRMPESYFDSHVPPDQYGFSKYLMTRYLLQAPGNIYNLRLFGVFGKYDDWRTRFPANACCRAVLDMPIQMRQNRSFDLLWIADLARIVEWFLMGTPRQNVYNVCTGTTCDFRTIAATILQAAGKSLPVRAEREGWGGEYSGDNRLLLAEMPAFQFTPLAAALGELYRWHDQNRQAIVSAEL